MRRRARGCVALAALLIAALALSACGSGGGEADVSSGPGTGSVGILLTDSPTDQFCSIMLIVNAVKLISDEGHVTIFEGSRRVDLLDLRDNTELITVGRRVPAGDYEKIRLEIDNKEVALFECDEDGDRIRPPEIADVPSGKIDLNPRGEFRLEDGSLLLIQLDMDAEKSIHAHETGNSMKWKFRPVVFVDIFTADVPDRLVRLTGVIENIATEPDRFDLCRSHEVSRPLNGDSGPRVMTSDNDDDGDDNGNGDDVERDTCVEIRVVEDTSIFLAEAVPGTFEELEEGSMATVLGRFLFSGEDLRLLAELVQQDPDTVEKVRGTIASELDGDVFDLVVDPDQIADLPEDLIAVLLQEGTKVYSRRGELLDPDDPDDPPIQEGRRARVVGFLDLTTPGEEEINASVVVVDLSEDPRERVSGVFLSWDEAAREMQLDADPETVCVPEDASVFLAELDEENDRIRFEESDPSEFIAGVTDVTAFGRTDTDCFEASTVLGFDLDD